MLKWFLILLMVFVILAPHPATAVDLGDLNVPADRIPTWYPFDETTYNAAQSWDEYDVTCAAGPCGSGKLPFTDDANLDGTCTAVSTGDFSEMDCMVDNATAGEVLYLPAGVYNLDTGEQLSIARSNIVIRGEDPDTTIIERTVTGKGGVGAGDCGSSSDAHFVSMCSIDYQSENETWDAGYDIGTTTIEVADSSVFSVDDWVWLSMDNSTSCEHLDINTGGTQCDGLTNDCFTHHAIITAIDGGADEITIDRGLRMKYDAAGCAGWRAHIYQPIINIGIEDLTFRTTTFTPNAKLILYRGVVSSWLVNCKLERSGLGWVGFQQSSRNWVQGNHFDELNATTFAQNGFSSGAGCVDNVYENNICTDALVCQKLQKGSEGIVTAYNYLNQEYDRCERSIFNHGWYSRGNLVEGNDVACPIHLIEDWWGRNGPFMTAYRNRNRSTHCESGPNTDRVPWGLTFGEEKEDPMRAGDWPNVIGNNVGEMVVTPINNDRGTPRECIAEGSDSKGTLSTYSSYIWFEKNIWRFDDGVPYPGFEPGTFNDRSCGARACSVTTTTYCSIDADCPGVETCDDDACPGTNVSRDDPDPGWAALDFPASLYRTTVPSWWCQEACAWDQTGIGAFGDDFGGSLCKLPAQIRYDEGVCTALGAEGAPNRGFSLAGGAINAP